MKERKRSIPSRAIVFAEIRDENVTELKNSLPY
jgi:hypothetical protein